MFDNTTNQNHSTSETHPEWMSFQKLLNFIFEIDTSEEEDNSDIPKMSQHPEEMHAPLDLSGKKMEGAEKQHIYLKSNQPTKEETPEDLEVQSYISPQREMELHRAFGVQSPLPPTVDAESIGSLSRVLKTETSSNASDNKPPDISARPKNIPFQPEFCRKSRGGTLLEITPPTSEDEEPEKEEGIQVVPRCKC